MRTDSNSLHARLPIGDTVSSVRPPSELTLPPTDNAGVSRSEQVLRPSTERTLKDDSVKTVVILAEQHNSDSPAASADAASPTPLVCRKRKLERASTTLADDASEVSRDGSNDIELVGPISRADLLSFLREQAQQRQQHETIRAEERMRSEDIRREEEWRFHEYQMSLMQLIQHSLAPFAVGGDDGNPEQSEHIALPRSSPLRSQRHPSHEENEEDNGLSSSDARVSPAAKLPDVTAAEPSAKVPSDTAHVDVVENAREVEMHSRTPSPTAEGLNASTTSSSPPQAESIRA
ncbi:hypothetical protein GGF44_000551 [Coemansia sp. RSA 1694]|nr:hypothetical protein GGF44_000551 [Coemansia sp. RSA 1694]